MPWYADLLYQESLPGIFTDPVLRILARVYAMGARTRRAWYRRRPNQVNKLPIPVISVGNLTVGGTGKTPLVLLLASELKRRGKRPVILSRGYGSSDREIRTVSDGKKILLNATAAGDEPYLLARRLSGVPIVVGPDRFSAGLTAQEHFSPDVVLLDDGFQHFQLARQIDIVLIDARAGLGPGVTLPRGPLREPLAALKYADAIVYTNWPLLLPPPRLTYQVSPWAARTPQYTAFYQPAALVSATGERLDPMSRRGRDAVVMLGIGNPRNFLTELETLGIRVAEAFIFADHHRYSARDLNRIRAAGREADLVLTSEKDFVRLPPAAAQELPNLHYLEVEMVLPHLEELMGELLNRIDQPL